VKNAGRVALCVAGASAWATTLAACGCPISPFIPGALAGICYLGWTWLTAGAKP